MLQIIEFFFLALKFFLQNGNLLPGFKIVICDVQLQQNVLFIQGLSPETVQFPVFGNLTIDIGSDSLHVIFTFIAA